MCSAIVGAVLGVSGVLAVGALAVLIRRVIGVLVAALVRRIVGILVRALLRVVLVLGIIVVIHENHPFLSLLCSLSGGLYEESGGEK